MESLTDRMDTINRLVNEGTITEALEAARTLVRDNPGSAEAWFTLGKILWKLGRRAEATSAYRTAADIEPSGPAAIALAHAQDIVDYFNPDLFNP